APTCAPGRIARTICDPTSARRWRLQQRAHDVVLPGDAVPVGQAGGLGPGHVRVLPIEHNLTCPCAIEQEGMDEEALAAGSAGQRNRLEPAHEDHFWRT